jgi:hypothetical protein
VEPVFANIRTAKSLNRFTYRGKDKVNTQWLLYCLVHNLEKLAHYGLEWLEKAIVSGSYHLSTLLLRALRPLVCALRLIARLPPNTPCFTNAIPKTSKRLIRTVSLERLW